MRTFRWVLIGLVALALVVFAVDNRQTVTVSLWPLPIEASMGLYLVLLLTLLAGFLLGELAAWMNGHHWRRKARQQEPGASKSWSASSPRNRRPRKPRAN